MPERRHVAGQPLHRQRLAIVVMIAAVAAAGCGLPNDTVVQDAPLTAQANAAPRETPSPSVPLVTAPPEPARPTQPATMVAAAPVRLQVPTIGVDTLLMGLGLQADGTLEVPASGFPAGWYHGSPTPGELGPAIIAGHVDWGGQPGVFFHLQDLSPGDDIEITRQDGSIAQFRVTHIEQFDKDAFPTEAVYGDLDHAGLRLITCTGAFDAALGGYDDNLVVFAELVGHTPT